MPRTLLSDSNVRLRRVRRFGRLDEFDRYYLFIAAYLPEPVTAGIPRTGAYMRMHGQLVAEQPIPESISKSVRRRQVLLFPEAMHPFLARSTRSAPTNRRLFGRRNPSWPPTRHKVEQIGTATDHESIPRMSPSLLRFRRARPTLSSVWLRDFRGRASSN